MQILRLNKLRQVFKQAAFANLDQHNIEILDEFLS